MYLNNPIPELASSFYSACYVDMDYIEYEEPEPKAYEAWLKEKPTAGTVPAVRPKSLHDLPRVKARRRPTVNDLEVFAMFSQTWGSTALGFGGIGGAAMTPAYTVIIANMPDRVFCVYFGGRFAYRVKNPKEVFFEDIRSSHMRAVYDKVCAYGEVS